MRSKRRIRTGNFAVTAQVSRNAQLVAYVAAVAIAASAGFGRRIQCRRA
jgi:hypothetical protein